MHTRLLSDDSGNLPQVAAPMEGSSGAPPLVEVLWRRRWTLALTVFGCMLIAALYLAIATPIYVATAKVVVAQNQVKLYSDAQGATPQSDTFLQTEADTFQSSAVLRRALDEVGYRKLKMFAKQSGDPVAWLRRGNGFKVDVARKSDVITVSMESPYPEEAANFVKAVVNGYIAEKAEQSRSLGTQIVQVLTKQKEQLRQKLEGQQLAMLKAKQEKGVLSFGEDRGNTALERSASLAASLTAAEIAVLELRAQHSAIRSALADPASLTAFVESQQFKAKDSGDREYDELRSQLNQLTFSYSMGMEVQGPNHPRVRTVQAAIDSLKKRVAAKERSIAEGALVAVSSQLVGAEQKERELRGIVTTQQGHAMELAPAALEYAKLAASAAQIQQQCDLLDKRIAEVSVDNIDAAPMNIRVMDPARAEELPVKPNKVLTLAATLLVGLILGIGMSLVREWRDGRLHRPEEIQVHLGTPVLAMVPRINPRLSASARGQIVLLDGRSPVAEAYRSVRASLHLGTLGSVKTILVASPARGDGKSVTASNVAMAFAEAGERTLLIDCDLREPVQHLIFGEPGDVGLTSVIAGEAKVRTAVCRTKMPGLFLLPCGPVATNPTELLSGRRFSQLMKALGQTFDRIVIDSPPVMRFTDARILAASADVTLLVFRMNQSMRPLGALALDWLAKVGANVVGAIANDVPANSAERYYGGSSQYVMPARRLLPVTRMGVAANGESQAVAKVNQQVPSQELGEVGPIKLDEPDWIESANGSGNGSPSAREVV